MKKKLSIVLAIVMVFALTAPVMANSFTDVPAGHWAYDAIDKATEAGIIDGYEDGTFKGDEKLTRYQMAVITAKMVDQLDDEETIKDLNKEQKQELTKAINSLQNEFNQELANLEERVSAIEDKELNVKVAGEATTTFTDTNVEGTPDFGNVGVEDGKYWDDWDDTLDDDAPAQKEFKQELDFDIQTIIDENTKASLTLNTIADNFAAPVEWDGTVGDSDSTQVKLDEILLAVNNPNYGVRIGDFEDYQLTDYFYDDEDVEGVEVTANYLDTELMAFSGQDDAATNRNTIKGLKVAKDIVGIDLAGEYLKADDKEIYGVTGQTNLTPDLSSKVKYVAKANNQSDNYLVDGETTAKLGAINLTAGYKEVGTNFDVVSTFKADSDIYGGGEDYEPGIKGYRVAGDMGLAPGLNVFANVEDEEVNGNNSFTTEVGANYAVTNKTDVSGSYEMVDADTGNVNTINLGLEGKYLADKLETAIDYEYEDNKGASEKTNTVDIRNDYQVTDAVALTADAQYETVDSTTETTRLYYAVGADHELTENTSLGVDYRVLDAEDYKAESVNGEFKVSF